MSRYVDLDKIEFLKVDGNDEFNHGVDCCINRLCKAVLEPCEDCISRTELLKAIDTWDKFGCDADTKLVPYKDHYTPYIHYDDAIKCIKGMPSVRPQGLKTEQEIRDELNKLSTYRVPNSNTDLVSLKAVERVLNLVFRGHRDLDPKTGHWIEVLDEIDSFGNKTCHHECSICGNKDSGWGEYKYCPFCGSKNE